MAEQYRLTGFRRFANWMLTRLLRLGVPMGNAYLLITRGRQTGQPHATPVTLVDQDGQRYLVAPYGEVGWVRNARAAGEVTLSRGRRNEHLPVTELDPTTAAPILKQYVQEIPIVRPFIEASPDDPVETFEREVPRHPVFRLG